MQAEGASWTKQPGDLGTSPKIVVESRLLRIVRPCDLHHHWKNLQCRLDSRCRLSEDTRYRRKIVVIATTVAACVSCVLVTRPWNDELSGSGTKPPAATVLLDSKLHFDSGKISTALHASPISESVHLKVPLELQKYDSAKWQGDKPPKPGIIEREYTKLSDTLKPYEVVEGRRKQPFRISQMVGAARESDTVQSAHSALMTLRDQYADADGGTSPYVQLSDAKRSINKLRLQLQSLRKNSDLAEPEENVISGQRRHVYETRSSDVQNQIASLFGNVQQQKAENTSALSNLTATEEQLKKLASSIRTIESKIETSRRKPLVAKDVANVFKDLSSPTAPLQSIVIKLRHSVKRIVSSNTSRVQHEEAHLRLTGANDVRTLRKPASRNISEPQSAGALLRYDRTKNLRTLQLSHFDSDGQSREQPKGCGCCPSSSNCSCCEQGWLGLQTFGKWLLMVLALVLCVMTFLIFGFMCFGCLWAWREFRRQDRWEKFLDGKTGKTDDDAVKPKVSEKPNSASNEQPEQGASAVKSAAVAPGSTPSGSSNARPIARRGDAQLAR